MDYLNFIANKIHTVVAATVDDDGLPITCAIDIMDADENGLYFLTAKGKNFYYRLKKRKYMALTGIKGKDTISCVAISVRGKVRGLGVKPLDRLFEKNPYMNKIYPTEKSRQVLTVFQLYEGSGEWFDLSRKPIERASFSIGYTEKEEQGYFITEKCVGCESCKAACPQNCIDFTVTPAVIRQVNCLHCGNCISVCPQNAVIRRT